MVDNERYPSDQRTPVASSPASRRTRAGLSAWVAAAALAATVFFAPSASAATPIGQPVVGGDTAVYGTGCRYPVGVVVDPRTPKTECTHHVGQTHRRTGAGRQAGDEGSEGQEGPESQEEGPAKYVYFTGRAAGAKEARIGDATLIAWAKPNAKGSPSSTGRRRLPGFRDVYVPLPQPVVRRRR